MKNICGNVTLRLCMGIPIKTVLTVLFLIVVTTYLCMSEGIDVSDAEATSGTTGDCTWTLDGTELTISGTGDMGNYSPDSEPPWKTSTTKVIIGDSVTSIGDYAFCVNTSLTSISIGNSVTSIGCCSFIGCSGLTSVTIPDSVTSIESSAFFNCTKVSNIIIGNSVTSIGDHAFYGCVSLTSISIGNSVTSIDSSAFYECTFYDSEGKTLEANADNLKGHLFSGSVPRQLYMVDSCSSPKAVEDNVVDNDVAIIAVAILAIIAIATIALIKKRGA